MVIWCKNTDCINNSCIEGARNECYAKELEKDEVGNCQTKKIYALDRVHVDEVE